MIIKASQRGGARALARHLLNAHDNEHVTVHQVRGAMARGVMGAMTEYEAIAKGTRCRQPLFSVSFNPPEQAQVSEEMFEQAIDKIEAANGLTGQPRVIVFHEKQGRRHAHCVWSRIDAERMKAVQLSHFKSKCNRVAKGLYQEYGWDMPRGFENKAARDPHNYTLAEYQQAKRNGRDAKQTKQLLQACWADHSDIQGFAQAARNKGFYLARGDRRGYVMVTLEGEILSLPKMLSVKTKEVRARLGDPQQLPSVEVTKAQIAEDFSPVIQRALADHKRQAALKKAKLEEQKKVMTRRHRKARHQQNSEHKARQVLEAKTRQARLRSGLRGLWQRLTGKHRMVKIQNELEVQAAQIRDRLERQTLVQTQLEERQTLQQKFKALYEKSQHTSLDLYRDIERYQRLETLRSCTATPRPEASRKLKYTRPRGWDLEL